MFRYTKPLAFIYGIAVLALASTLPALRADDATTTTAPASAPSTGTVTGTLVDADGKALTVPVKVTLTVPKVKGSKEKHKPIATVKSDDQGNYSFADVPPGTYTVGANGKNVGRGHSASPITVDAGKETKVDPITIKPKPVATTTP
jgi:hypothetical protein